jgi:hypothetical protein
MEAENTSETDLLPWAAVRREKRNIVSLLKRSSKQPLFGCARVTRERARYESKAGTRNEQSGTSTRSETCLTRWCAAARPAHPAPATATFFRCVSPPGGDSARKELCRRRWMRREEDGSHRPPATGAAPRAVHQHIPSAGSFGDRKSGGTNEWPGLPLQTRCSAVEKSSYNTDHTRSTVYSISTTPSTLKNKQTTTPSLRSKEVIK